MLDVIIAGAGPAGSIAALVLARAGARVVIVDREQFPRDKLCGDTLNPGAVRLLQTLDVADQALAGSLPLRGMRVSGPTATVTAEYSADAPGRSIRRRDFDTALLSAAVHAGARFESGFVARRPLVDDAPRGAMVRGLVLSSRGSQRELRMPALMTIAADGRRSLLARALGLSRPPARRRWAFGAYVSNVGGVGEYGEMHIRHGWYLGLAPVPGGLINVCAVTRPRPQGRTPLEVIRQTAARDPALAERLARLETAGPVQVLGPLAADVRAPGAPGLLLAGDAAGFVDPMTGDGLHLAMRGALLAADEALRTLTDGTFSASTDRLAAARRHHLGAKLRFNRWLRSAVDVPGAIGLASRGAHFVPDLVRRAIYYAGDTA
jgi:flavin-dependent dehydrogenase